MQELKDPSVSKKSDLHRAKMKAREADRKKRVSRYRPGSGPGSTAFLRALRGIRGVGPKKNIIRQEEPALSFAKVES